jgi:Dolichyl-phosphate-mannose-protein mannosyltransferase
MIALQDFFLRNEPKFRTALMILGMAIVLACILVWPWQAKYVAAAVIPGQAGSYLSFIVYAPVIAGSFGLFLVYFAVRQFPALLHEQDKFPVFLKVVIGFLLMLFLLLSQTRYLDNDEYEHLHNAWLMLQGTVPWFSLTMRHFPLLEWLIALFMKMVGERALIIQVMRLVTTAISLGSLWLVYKIAVRLFQAETTALLAVVLLATNFAWVRAFHEIRPDNLMLFFALLSFYWLVRYQAECRLRCLVFFVLSAVLSFLGKQNAAIFYFALGSLFIYSFVFLERKGNLRLIVIACGLGAFILWLPPVRIFLLTDIKRYMLPNKTFQKFWPLSELLLVTRFNPAVFFLFFLQLFSPLNLADRYRDFRRFLLGIPVICFVFLFLMNMPYLQEMLVMAVFMSIAAASLLADLADRLVSRARYAAIVFLLLPVLLFTLEGTSIRSMAEDYRTTEKILQISQPGDLVFDSFGKAIFRHHPLDPHYQNYNPREFKRLQELKASGVKYLIKDEYYWSLPPATLTWFDENFTPVAGITNIFVRKN